MAHSKTASCHAARHWPTHRPALVLAVALVTIASAAQPSEVAAQARLAVTPVPPDPANFMWQTLQDQFLDASGAACSAKLSLAVSDRATCYADASGVLRCDGSIYDTAYRFDAPAGPTGVDQIMLSPTFNDVNGNGICVHQTGGTVSCMGSHTVNAWGQFGNGDTTAAPLFTTWGGGRSDIARLGTGTWDQMCVLTNAGEVHCSGYGYGLTPQLVGAATRFYVAPWGIADIAPTVDRASAGRTECTIAGGALSCPGSGAPFGVEVVDGGQRLSTGSYPEMCVLDRHGVVTCRRPDPGAPDFGASTDYSLFGGGVLTLATNYYTARACAVKTDGSLWCADGGGGTEVEVQPAGSLITSCDGTGGVSPDRTPPVVKPIVTGVQGRNGWYVGDVQVAWSVVDRESPVTAQLGCSSSYVFADTDGTTFTCTARSGGGTTVESFVVKRDATPPQATSIALPVADANGWRRQPVLVTHVATDALGTPTCDPAVRLARDGAQQAALGLCRDAAGNASATQSEWVNVDRTAPVVTVASPASTTYVRGAVVAADFSCRDDLSGVAVCDGTVSSGGLIDTSTAGSGRFVVTATDLAGNTTRKVISYRVR